MKLRDELAVATANFFLRFASVEYRRKLNDVIVSGLMTAKLLDAGWTLKPPNEDELHPGLHGFRPPGDD